MNGSRAAVFLDRDGTIIRDKEYLADPRGIELLPGAVAGLRALAGAGLALVVVSNQSGVARGLFPESAVAAVNAALGATLAKHGVTITGWYHCPHGPDSPCQCRKPAPGMIFQAAKELGLDVPRSFAVGDRERDVEAGKRAGVRGTVRIGPEAEQGVADHVAKDLDWAARWIVARASPP